MIADVVFSIAYAVGAIGLSAAACVLPPARARRTPAVAAARRSPEALGPYEVAYLAGGARLAVAAAIQALCDRRLLEVTPGDGRLATCGAPDGRLAPLERAVHEAARRQPILAEEAYRAARPALAALDQALVARGLVPTRVARRLVSLVPLTALATLGLVAFAWLRAGPHHPDARGFVGLCLFFSTCALGMLAVPRPSWRTAAGAATVRELRERHREHAIWARCGGPGAGADERAMFVGLFGLRALGAGPLTRLAGRSPTGRWRVYLIVDDEAGDWGLGDSADAGDGDGDGGGGDGGGD